MQTQLQEKLKTLPRSPGVYFHKSASGEIIYVGKAAVLKNRVRQYFQSQRDMDIKTRALVAEIDDTDWVETESEIDALFLESEMVKRYMPRYNILLRDDKSQMYVRIDMKSEWPHVSFTRNPADDGADYFGPYYNGYAIKKALRYLRRVFPYFTKVPDGKGSKLEMHIGLNPDMAHGSDAYKANLRKLIRYFKGGRKQLISEIERDMQTAAGLHEFERAAELRNKLRDLKELQRRICFGDREFLDISKDRALSDLTDLLHLPKPPQRIEGYDISHMGGTNVVASMVVFTNGVSDRSEYRKFKMQVQQNDDYRSMREVITRRLKHLKDWGKPDLVLIDGGIGQLNAVADLLRAEGIPFVGRNKSGNHGRNAPVQLVLPEQEVAIQHDSHLAKLIARIDDESHRFAVSYHTVLKRQKQTASSLEDIPGIGPATRKKLLRTFGSLRGIKAADRAQLIDTIGEAKTAQLLTYL